MEELDGRTAVDAAAGGHGIHIRALLLQQADRASAR
jgi:hypothetical protein